jgi:hypothetical protein
MLLLCDHLSCNNSMNHRNQTSSSWVTIEKQDGLSIAATFCGTIRIALTKTGQNNYIRSCSAEVAELVDALGSGSSGGFLVGVQISPSAPSFFFP